jgi:hypothetical protein
MLPYIGGDIWRSKRATGHIAPGDGSGDGCDYRTGGDQLAIRNAAARSTLEKAAFVLLSELFLYTVSTAGDMIDSPPNPRLRARKSFKVMNMARLGIDSLNHRCAPVVATAERRRGLASQA